MSHRLTLLMLIAVTLIGCSGEQFGIKQSDEIRSVVVYKSPTCGCCGLWVEHIQEEGFEAKVIDRSDLTSIKKKYGIIENARSCHTAVYQDRYVFEGHIPAKVMQKFLNNPPDGARGLVVPGMPIGSPGMESGTHFQPYVVWLLDEKGEFSEYAKIESYDQQFAVNES